MDVNLTLDTKYSVPKPNCCTITGSSSRLLKIAQGCSTLLKIDQD